MLLLIMGFLIFTGLYIFGKFGISKNAKAEYLALYASTVALLWSIFQIAVSFSPQYNLYVMLPIMHKIKDWVGVANASSTPALALMQGGPDTVAPANAASFKDLETVSSYFNWTKPVMTGEGILDSYSSLYLNTDYANFDGLTSVFVGLTTIITPIAILASEKKTEMLSSLLLVEALLIGAFVTFDFVTFYALFESVLIPMFFLIGGTGSGATLFRTAAAYRLFLYTLGGSVLMLLSLIVLYLETGTLNWYFLVLKGVYSNASGLATENNISNAIGFFSSNKTLPLSTLPLELATPYPKVGQSNSVNIGILLFPLIFVAFAVKVPMIPVHLWLPEAHTIAPTPGSMILAALLLKLGGYGLLRWLMPIFPDATIYYSPVILVLAVISTTFACLTCLRQIDIKRIVAYSSIVHMNICIYSIFTLSPLAIKGAIFEMFSHGIISTGMFFLIGVVYNRHDTRILKYFRGLALTMPLFTTIFFIFVLANSAVPLTCGFIGEFIMLSGSMQALPFLTIILTISTIVNAAYNIWLFNRMCFGGYSPYLVKTKDITRKEAYVLAPLLFYIVLLGICPNFVFMLIDGSI